MHLLSFLHLLLLLLLLLVLARMLLQQHKQLLHPEDDKQTEKARCSFVDTLMNQGPSSLQCTHQSKALLKNKSKRLAPSFILIQNNMSSILQYTCVQVCSRVGCTRGLAGWGLVVEASSATEDYGHYCKTQCCNRCLTSTTLSRALAFSPSSHM